MNTELADIISETHRLHEELRLHVVARRAISDDYRESLRDGRQSLVLLRMAEGLIHAHRAAKQDGDGLTLNLIEDAMGHVGKRLYNELDDRRRVNRVRVPPQR